MKSISRRKGTAAAIFTVDFVVNWYVALGKLSQHTFPHVSGNMEHLRIVSDSQRLKLQLEIILSLGLEVNPYSLETKSCRTKPLLFLPHT